MKYGITKTDAFPDFENIEFEFENHRAILVKPNNKPNGKWAFKTEYFGAFPSLETELLNRGWHVAYIKNDNRWALDADLERKVRFIEFISKEFQLEQKCAMVGMSCGGLYAARLSILAPHLVSVLYLDAPVLNLLSCPCALGDAEVSLFDEYHKVTGMTISQMICYRESPIDKLDVLIKNNIPVFLVAGDCDEVVPYHENGEVLEKYYKDNNGDIEVCIKHGCKHHPHGLENPDIIADFIERH